MEIKDIEKLARLARIDLTTAEKEHFANDLEKILGYIDQIREVATTERPAEVGETYNVLREDVVSVFPDPEILRKAFPAREGDFLKVRAILKAQ